jgi:hypothetical protein
MRSRPVREIRKPARAALLLALAGLVAGCGSVKSPTEPTPPAGGPAFTFARIQAEIFTPTCAKAGCHAASAASGGMVLEAGRAYAEIVNRRSTERSDLDRIEPGDPERSYLIKKLRGDADITGTQMPQDRPGSLSREQLDGIIAWVRAGAPND